MNIFLPNNIFSKFIVKNLFSKKQNKINFFPSSVLTYELSKDKSAVALIPSFDLLKNEDLFVSSKFGLSFEGNLSNSYFYFKGNSDMKKLNVVGDASSTEILLSEIIYREDYNTELEIEISQTNKDKEINTLVIGDDNFVNYDVTLGLSLSEKLSDLMEIQYPFVNYVIASFKEDNLKYFNDKAEHTQNKIYDMVENDIISDSLNIKAKSFIKDNISSLIINLEEQDREGLTEELKLPYYHGIIKSMIDINFV